MCVVQQYRAIYQKKSILMWYYLILLRQGAIASAKIKTDKNWML